MAWIEVHQALLTHRKTLAAADILDIPEVYLVGHLVALWSWALDNAKDGNLPTSARFIARAAHWTGDPEQFVNALCAAGFLDGCDGDVRRIHDFDDYVGRLIDKREANAERMRNARAARRSQPAGERATHVQNTCDARAYATQPAATSTQPTSTSTAPCAPATACRLSDDVRMAVRKQNCSTSEIDAAYSRLVSKGHPAVDEGGSRLVGLLVKVIKDDIRGSPSGTAAVRAHMSLQEQAEEELREIQALDAKGLLPR